MLAGLQSNQNLILMKKETNESWVMGGRDSISEEMKRDDLKNNDQSLNCQGDPYNIPEDRFNSD